MSASICLTAEGIGVLGKWYAGPTGSSGRHLYPGGIPQGSEPYWPLWLTGKPRDRLPVLVPLSAEDFLCYMAFADNPDLSAFAARGGTLLVYHRWADPVVTPCKPCSTLMTCSVECAPPDWIPSARIGADGAAAWSRPVCPYPESAGCGP